MARGGNTLHNLSLKLVLVGEVERISGYRHLVHHLPGCAGASPAVRFQESFPILFGHLSALEDDFPLDQRTSSGLGALLNGMHQLMRQQFPPFMPVRLVLSGGERDMVSHRK